MTRATRRQFWVEQVRDFRESGMARSRFCRERGYTAWALRHWEKRLPDVPAGKPPERANSKKFVAVAVANRETVGMSSDSRSVRVRLPMGIEIESTSWPEAGWVTDVLVGLSKAVAQC